MSADLNASTDDLLNKLKALRKEAQAKTSHLFEASKYCPEPWSANLVELSDAFSFFEMQLADCLFQVEAVFDNSDNNILNNGKGPGD